MDSLTHGARHCTSSLSIRFGSAGGLGVGPESTHYYRLAYGVDAVGTRGLRVVAVVV